MLATSYFLFQQQCETTANKYPKINIAHWKICISVHFIECTEITWNKRDENGLFVSIFIKNMEWYLGVIGKFIMQNF